MIILNILGTIERGFFNRNIPVKMLEEYSDDYPNKDEVIERLEHIAKFYSAMNFIENSYWVNKANFFSIIIFLYQNYDIVHKRDPLEIKEKLDQFEKELPNEYQLAAKEAVNNKKERIIRDKHLRRLILLQESIKENK
jgi:hypothetical protein